MLSKCSEHKNVEHILEYMLVLSRNSQSSSVQTVLPPVQKKKFEIDSTPCSLDRKESCLDATQRYIFFSVYVFEIIISFSRTIFSPCIIAFRFSVNSSYYYILWSLYYIVTSVKYFCTKFFIRIKGEVLIAYATECIFT